jgi:methyl-accepting chemotaxis protein
VKSLAEDSQQQAGRIDEITDTNRAQREGIDEVVESVRRLTETGNGGGPSESERGREGAVVSENQGGGRDGSRYQ